jgi:hypothetical protein
MTLPKVLIAGIFMSLLLMSEGKSIGISIEGATGSGVDVEACLGVAGAGVDLGTGTDLALGSGIGAGAGVVGAEVRVRAGEGEGEGGGGATFIISKKCMGGGFSFAGFNNTAVTKAAITRK